MQITFLESQNGLSLSKNYDEKNGFNNYPHVKSVTSHQYNISLDAKGLTRLENLIREHSKKGNCLLKGNLKKPLVNESRAGQTSKTETTNLLVLDVDGVKLPKSINFTAKKLTKKDVTFLANQVIDELPIELKNVSYIAQASASLGLKSDKISLHIFMLLSVAMPTKSIKLWLQDINFESDVFSEQLSLSVNGQSLRYPLDLSVADNSKIIFIAPPTFNQPDFNPFKTNDDRIIKVQRSEDTFDLAALMRNISPQKCFEKAQKYKDKLRESFGFSKKQLKTRITTIDNESVEILTNPDKMSITIVDDSNFPYIRCNINGGDSCAYYFNMRSPIYMYNFKGEPIFEIEKADQEFYLSLQDKFEEKLKDIGQRKIPIVLRDYETDTFFNGVYDPNIGEFDKDFPLTKIKKQNIDDFFMNHGKISPDYIPDGRVIFDPTSTEDCLDFNKTPYYVNTYQTTKYIKQPKEPLLEQNLPLSLGYSTKHISNNCPLVYKVIYHMLGNGDEEFERFINWLAYIYQTRNKSGTCWVLQGVQGTGKGIFYSKILRPLFGKNHVPMKTLINIDEKYNGYMRDALFLIVDEFHMASSSASVQKIADQLKSNITEATVNIREMYQNATEPKSYVNYIFLTNRVDAINLDQGDRRYNIAPRQEQRIVDKYPELTKQLDSNKIEKELYFFSGILKDYKVDKQILTSSYDNTAKNTMRHVSMSVFEEFCSAILQGQLSYFVDLLDINPSNVMNAAEIDAAQRFVKSWIATGLDKYHVIPMEHLRTVYHIITEQNPRLSQREFHKRMARFNINPERKRPYNSSRETNQIRGVVTTWNTNDLELKQMRDQYFSENDKKLLLS